MAKNILLFGAGKSASVLISYLLEYAGELDWEIWVADADLNLVLSKTKNHPLSRPFTINILEAEKRRNLIEEADLVISMMPPSLHYLIAVDCLHLGKNLLTASYVDEKIRPLEDEIKSKGLLFLCEMGLDPGIDHMSAAKIFDEMKEKNQEVIAFKSHCGGLVAPESDDNPWHYKITWNPRNVVVAGKNGADYMENGREIHLGYDEVFNSENQVVSIDHSFETFNFYPNRNSIPYIDLYGLKNIKTFIRTTLRHPDFITGWKKIVDLGLTNEMLEYPATDYNLHKFYQDWGFKNSINWKDVFSNDPLFKTQMLAIGFEDDTPLQKQKVTAADIIQIGMEKHLSMQPNDKDLVVMVHEVEYVDGAIIRQMQSSLMVKGDNNIDTAMAKTVGLPLGIAAKLILTDQLNITGLHVPILKEIYLPVLQELENNGIVFREVIAGCN